MSRTKGTEKTGGRSKGTPNKITGTLKEFISEIIDENRERIREDLEALEPKDRLQILEKLMQYVLPKQRELDLKEPLSNHVTIEYVESGRKPANSEEEVLEEMERERKAGIPLAHSEDEIVD